MLSKSQYINNGSGNFVTLLQEGKKVLRRFEIGFQFSCSAAKQLLAKMTVTLLAKYHEVSKDDDNPALSNNNDNITCYCSQLKETCPGCENLIIDEPEDMDSEISGMIQCECTLSEDNRRKMSITTLCTTKFRLSDKDQKKPGDDAQEIDFEFEFYEKARRLLPYEDAPEYLKHNCYIETGYRGILPTKLCVESIFWWTNETINIWSHIFGFVLFLGLSFRDVLAIDMNAPLGDKFLVGVVLISFQICMVLSAVYHTFSCRSERDCDFFLSFDLFGIAISLLGIYTSGIYYAFWCDPHLKHFYLITITVIFIFAMVLQIPSLQVDANVKMIVFVAWAAYGVLPTFHWVLYMGGFDNPIVALLFPRVVGMYAISGTAFLIYLTKVPERFYSGKFDYLGHSHQWWHFFVVLALYYWHNSGVIYIEYRMNHGCSSGMTIF